MSNIVTLKEDWVTFYRYPCKEGHIDKWFGDCINNPNNTTKNQMNLNMSAEYFRLNDGKWYQRDCFNGHFSRSISTLKDDFTAQDIWDSYFKGELG